MLIRKLSLLPFVIGLLCSSAGAQEPMTLAPGKAIDREIAGGQTHSYQFALTAGQFLHIVLEQRSINLALALAAPDGKQVAGSNLTGAGGMESLSAEAAASGLYQLTIRSVGSTRLAGSYQMQVEVKASTTAQDRERVAAERWMMEANELRRQAGKAAEQADKLQQALSVWRELGDSYLTALSLSNLGLAYVDLGRREQAIEHFEEALTIFRQVKSRYGEAFALTRIGNVQINEEKAVEYHEQALAIFRAIKDRPNEGLALNNLGLAYSGLSRYEKAIECQEQARDIAREMKDRIGEGRALHNLGISYWSLGRFEKALEGCEQALVIFREVKDRLAEGRALTVIGSTWYRLNHFEKAIEYHEQALAIHREVKNRRSEGIALNSLGQDYLKLNQYNKAIAYNEQAWAIAREIKARGNEITPLLSLGESHRLLAQYEKAAQFHEQALAAARQVKHLDGEAEALNHLLLDWKARNQPSLAIFFGKQSVNAYQEIRSNIRSLDRESQQSFLKSKEDTYRNLADLMISQGRLPEAEQVIRMLKEEEYFEYIRRDEINSPQSQKVALTPEEEKLDKRYREIADKLTEIGTERNTLMEKKERTPVEEQRLAKLETDLIVAGQAFQKFLDGLATEMGKNADTNARAFQLRESQGVMEDLRELGKGVVALYTLIGEDKYRVILTTADFQRGYEYPIKAAELNRKVLAFRDVLQNPKLDPLPLAQELYKILVGPVAKDLQGTKAQMLMWSLDGVLRYLPVAALHDGKQYLVERYRTAVFTPASQSRLRVEPSRKWTALGLGVTKAHGPTIPALPGVLEEMHGIIQEAGVKTGVLPGSIKLDEAFTQEAMLSELRKRNPVVHIASHFKFQPGNETNSALLLGDGNFLSLAQIKSLPNVFAGVDLLTLSACNTATGGSGANGKEVEGFGVLAQRQGAKAVVASLWPVADRSTKNLMQEFYKLREAKADISKVEALRQAQIRLLRGELQVTGEILAARSIVHEEDKMANRPTFKVDPKAPYAHPYYWAPFILIGNWK